ncbi:MAG TPA: hypothetical protein VMF87_23835 [Streptosporangiaceae bacterium]|nr:hypothetical protein [Streptosporangiaceae bacterium]
MNKMVLEQKAEDELRRDLLPGEQVAVGSIVTSDPSRWGAAVLAAVSLALVVVGLLTLLGPLSGGPFMAVAPFALGLGVFLPRPMYVAVTDRRLICSRMSRFRRRPGRLAVALPLADLRILNYRRSKSGASIRCEIPGGKPVTLHWSRARRADFARVELALARSGAFATLDPPYPLEGSANVAAR